MSEKGTCTMCIWSSVHVCVCVRACVCAQVVSDYLTGLGDPQAYMEAGNRPVTMYTYRMSFVRSSRNSA